jgi:hypothetical protein
LLFALCRSSDSRRTLFRWNGFLNTSLEKRARRDRPRCRYLGIEVDDALAIARTTNLLKSRFPPLEVFGTPAAGVRGIVPKTFTFASILACWCEVRFPSMGLNRSRDRVLRRAADPTRYWDRAVLS